jgi:hypothetical protein
MISFDDFWTLVPEKRSKKAARTAWDRAVKKKPPEQIISAYPLYLADCRKHKRFICYPATWLNGERWNDELSPTYQPRIESSQYISRSFDSEQQHEYWKRIKEQNKA